MKNEVNLRRVVDFLFPIDSAKSREYRGKVGYVGCVGQNFTSVTWVEVLFSWIIIFTWFAWVKIFCMGQFFLRGSKFFAGV